MFFNTSFSCIAHLRRRNSRVSPCRGPLVVPRQADRGIQSADEARQYADTAIAAAARGELGKAGELADKTETTLGDVQKQLETAETKKAEAYGFVDALLRFKSVTISKKIVLDRADGYDASKSAKS